MSVLKPHLRAPRSFLCLATGIACALNKTAWTHLPRVSAPGLVGRERAGAAGRCIWCWCAPGFDEVCSPVPLPQNRGVSTQHRKRDARLPPGRIGNNPQAEPLPHTLTKHHRAPGTGQRGAASSAQNQGLGVLQAGPEALGRDKTRHWGRLGCPSGTKTCGCFPGKAVPGQRREELTSVCPQAPGSWSPGLRCSVQQQAGSPLAKTHFPRPSRIPTESKDKGQLWYPSTKAKVRMALWHNWLNPRPIVSASHVGAGSCPSSSTSNPAPC